MRAILNLSMSAIVVAAGLAATAAPARPHRVRVCHRERHLGHPVRVCHWRR